MSKGCESDLRERVLDFAVRIIRPIDTTVLRESLVQSRVTLVIVVVVVIVIVIETVKWD